MKICIPNLNWRAEAVIEGETYRKVLPGELIAVDTGQLLEPSPERISPFCPVYETCGGCQLQHWQPEPYQHWKASLISSALHRQGITVPPPPLLDGQGAPGNQDRSSGRRRITLHGRKQDETLVAGFMAARSHAVVNISHCPVLVPALSPAPEITRCFAEKLGTCDVAITAADNGLDVNIKAERKVADNQLPALSRLASQLQLARLTLNNQLVVQTTPPTITMGKAHLTLPSGSFLQATAKGEEILSSLVSVGVGKAKNIADLFCGLGPFALRLSEKARVYAADNDKPAVQSLAQAALKTPGLKPIKTDVRDLMREPLVANELKEFDAVIFDPPRAGAEAQARQLAKSTVKTVVAVSCDPASFARDAAIIIAGGYQLKDLTAVDQFKWTSHVEIVGVFTRSAKYKKGGS